jgi:hypothetical protein
MSFVHVHERHWYTLLDNFNKQSRQSAAEASLCASMQHAFIR